jgi:hypothetical protein
LLIRVKVGALVKNSRWDKLPFPLSVRWAFEKLVRHFRRWWSRVGGGCQNWTFATSAAPCWGRRPWLAASSIAGREGPSASTSCAGRTAGATPLRRCDWRLRLRLRRTRVCTASPVVASGYKYYKTILNYVFPLFHHSCRGFSSHLN